ncbi:MAG: tRNA pseudouridine(38-40) synthase TruA [Lachnospiraceae bacterium]|nr:tRNA pseudouridine(38-40) synthase TruA [Lachnospiraceae bacterium]MDY6221474.1 tRNA pseudouridine(38-40) synthase TruA [Candidatus Alectryocaccobium sp.]
MRRIFLEIAYDGTNYSGWQVQNNAVSVQETIDKALSEWLGEEIHTIGASRTDAGVHARGNVAVFDTESLIPADKFAFGLNARLPEDISIQESFEVPAEFHPRFTETIKTYEYKILNRRFPDPTRRNDSLFYYGKLNVDAMNEAAAYLVGPHDFKSFCAVNHDAKTTVRTIYSAMVDKDGDIITFEITGNGFLYNMVRIIAGTLIEVGKGKLKPEDIKMIMEARDRQKAGPTAPAHGLTLVEIEYPEWE